MMKAVLAEVMPVPKPSLDLVRSGVCERDLDCLLATHGSSVVPGALGLGGFELFPGVLQDLAEPDALGADAAAELAFQRSRGAAERHRFFRLSPDGREGGEFMQHPQDP